MFMTDIIGGEEAEEGSTIGSGFNCGSSFRLFTLNKADDCDHAHAGFLCGLDGSDGAAAGGADIVDDEDGRVLFEEAFDTAAGAMCLFRLAHEEAVNEPVLRVRERAVGTRCGDIGNDRVCAHRKSADGVGMQMMFRQQVENGQAGKAAAFGMERRCAAVDVVVAGGPGGERKVSELEGCSGEQGEKGGACVGHGVMVIQGAPMNQVSWAPLLVTMSR